MSTSASAFRVLGPFARWPRPGGLETRLSRDPVSAAGPARSGLLSYRSRGPLHLVWYDGDTPEDREMLAGRVQALRRAGIDPGLPHTEALLDRPLP
jgi:hypothetical protein